MWTLLWDFVKRRKWLLVGACYFSCQMWALALTPDFPHDGGLFLIAGVPALGVILMYVALYLDKQAGWLRAAQTLPIPRAGITQAICVEAVLVYPVTIAAITLPMLAVRQLSPGTSPLKPLDLLIGISAPLIWSIAVGLLFGWKSLRDWQGPSRRQRAPRVACPRRWLHRVWQAVYLLCLGLVFGLVLLKMAQGEAGLLDILLLYGFAREFARTLSSAMSREPLPGAAQRRRWPHVLWATADALLLYLAVRLRVAEVGRGTLEPMHLLVLVALFAFLCRDLSRLAKTLPMPFVTRIRAMWSKWLPFGRLVLAFLFVYVLFAGRGPFEMGLCDTLMALALVLILWLHMEFLPRDPAESTARRASLWKSAPNDQAPILTTPSESAQVPRLRPFNPYRDAAVRALTVGFGCLFPLYMLRPPLQEGGVEGLSLVFRALLFFIPLFSALLVLQDLPPLKVYRALRLSSVQLCSRIAALACTQALFSYLGAIPYLALLFHLDLFFILSLGCLWLGMCLFSSAATILSRYYFPIVATATLCLGSMLAVNITDAPWQIAPRWVVPIACAGLLLATSGLIALYVVIRRSTTPYQNRTGLNLFGLKEKGL